MRSKIKEKLLEIDSNVYYGIIPDNVEIETLDYFVFGQSKMRKSGTSSNDLNGYWYVVIVREEYIHDDVIKQVISKLTEIHGLRLADGDYEYNYIQKGNTNIIVEMCTLTFTKMKKGITDGYS